MKGLIIFIAVFTLIAAVPLERRAVNTDEHEKGQSNESKLNGTAICAAQTPCGWSVYKASTKIIDFNMNNSYCICGPNESCEVSEDDASVNAFILRCKEKTPEEAQSDQS